MVTVKHDSNGVKDWEDKRGSGEGNGIATDASGNVYSCGSVSSDILIIKYYPDGTEAWNTTWGGANSEAAEDLVLDSSGNLYVCGYTESSGAGGRDFLLAKFYPNGTKAWNTTWGGWLEEWAYDIAIDTSGNLYLCGYTKTFGAGDSDLALVKFDPNMTKLWNITWGGGSAERGHGVTIDNSGNLYVIGYTFSFAVGSGDVALLKYYPNGTKAWHTTWGGAEYDVGKGIVFDGKENLYVCGHSQSFGVAGRALIVQKYLLNKTLLWNITWDTPLWDEGMALALDGRGNLYVTGHVLVESGNWDFLLIKFKVGEPPPIPGFELLFMIIGLLPLITIYFHIFSYKKVNKIIR
jgi:hypothetical protein